MPARRRTRPSGAGSRRSAASASRSNGGSRCRSAVDSSAPRRSDRVAEVVGDRRVVLRDPRERIARQSLAVLASQCSRRSSASSSSTSAYCSGFGHHRHALEVLRRRPDHARAADVDVLDRLGLGHARLRDRLLERVEVAHHEVDFRQLVLGERLHVLRLVALRQQAGVDRRVQRLHAAVEDFGERRSARRRPSPAARRRRAPSSCRRWRSARRRTS